MNVLRTMAQGALLAGAAWALTGCVVRGQGGLVTTGTLTVPAPPPPPTATLTANVTVPTGVTVLQTACQQGAQEQCNGLDDNCNGVIDEGCGYSTGNIQITAAWNTSSDIDLHVVDPAGEEVYYGHTSSASGGRLDHDANAACSVAPPTVENVFWSASPPSGQYHVRLVAYDMCGQPATPVTLSIAVGGRVVGSYSFNFTYQRQEFDLPFSI